MERGSGVWLQLELHLGGKEQLRRRGGVELLRQQKHGVFFTENDVTELNIYEVGVACRLKSVLLLLFCFFCFSAQKFQRRPLKK